MQCGLVVDLHPTNYELRLGILQRKAAQFAQSYGSIKIDDGVFEFLAHRITTNVRVLEGALQRLFAFSSLMGQEVTLDMVQDCLSDMLRSSERRVTVEEIQRKVAEHFNIRLSDMLGPKRTRTIARPRQIAMYLSKEMTSRSLPEIGRRFGGRDHTTILHGVRKAVSQAQSVVERRNTIPILANVLIEAEGGHVSFRATDLDIEVVDRAPAMVDRAGATTVSAVLLHEIIRKLPDGALVSLADDPRTGRLTVEAGRSSFQLTTLAREDFPVMASSEYQTSFTAKAGVLKRLFEKSKFAVSTEETRYYLNGVYFHVADGDGGRVLRCVATDGHRLARIDTPCLRARMRWQA
jgi:hypothetical protein